MELPECHSRHDIESETGSFFCCHPKVHVQDAMVTADICRLCSYWKEPPPETVRPVPTRGLLRNGPCIHLGEQIDLRECEGCRGSVKVKIFGCRHPAHDETTLSGCQSCRDYEIQLRQGDITNWAVGVTTAPRPKSTLERCLASLQAAGWDEPRVFAEPDVEIPASFQHLLITRRESRLGGWPNWYLGLAELVLREPWADAYLMVQDDTELCRNIRPMLEQLLWPSSRLGVVSVYCPAVYGQRTPGLHEVKTPWNLIGALTFIFPNVAARSLLADARTVTHRQRGAHDGLRSIDTVVGRWAHAAGLPVYYHWPSLAQHIGDDSTLWPQASNTGRRSASRFVGASFDAMGLLTADAQDVQPTHDRDTHPAEMGDAISETN